MIIHTTTQPPDNRDRLLAYRAKVGTLDAIAWIEWGNPELALARCTAEPVRKWPWERLS